MRIWEVFFWVRLQCHRLKLRLAPIYLDLLSPTDFSGKQQQVSFDKSYRLHYFTDARVMSKYGRKGLGYNLI